MRTTATVACVIAGVLTIPGITGRVYADPSSSPAQAASDAIKRGVIIQIEAGELYFNIAADTGLQPGDALRIKRPISLRHPITRKPIEDWIPVGIAQVTAVGRSMAMAVVDPGLLADVQVGDIVEVLILVDARVPEPHAPNTPQTMPNPPALELPKLDGDTAAVLAVWENNTGRDINLRIGAWEEFLATYPDSPYAQSIREDLDVLRTQRDMLTPPDLSFTDSGAMADTLLHDPPQRGIAGQSLPLAFLLATHDVATAWLHYRPTGAATYSKAVLHRDGSGYLRGEIPASIMTAPGVEYFVEVSTPRGTAGAAIGSPGVPHVVVVPEPPLAAASFSQLRGRSQVSITTSYLDFANLDTRDGDRQDQFVLVEADFLYRLRRQLYGIRTGFGVLRGTGGFADRVYTADDPAPDSGFTYGYVEAELRKGDLVGVIVRGVVGVGSDGFGVGAEGHVRFGREDDTNLTLGLSHLQEIGFLTSLRMQWNALAGFPLGLSVALTDQPTGGDLGVRLTTDIGYRALSWVRPTVRIAYQARTVEHAGIGAGLGLVFDW